jgi:hypothetical protein
MSVLDESSRVGSQGYQHKYFKFSVSRSLLPSVNKHISTYLPRILPQVTIEARITYPHTVDPSTNHANPLPTACCERGQLHKAIMQRANI